jgi:integrase
MPRQSKGTRLWLEPAEYTADGKVRRRATWVIRDGSRKIRTGCARGERERAERKLAEYLAAKYQPSRTSGRYPSDIPVIDVLNIYDRDVVSSHARPVETGQRLLKLAEFWGPYSLDEVTGARCRQYEEWRCKQTVKSTKNKPRLVTKAAARRELEDLRAAINHHRREGLCSEIVSVVLPENSPGRDVYLTRLEAARLIRAAWRAKQIMRDKVTVRDVGKHIARFILVGLYTGTRHAAICGAAFRQAVGRGYLDLDRGVFYRRAKGERETKKRQTPVRLPDRLLAHLRRWHRLGIATHAVVEWNGKPVRLVRKGFASAVKAAGLPTSGPDRITPHVLRHTAATWAMQQGADLWQAAGFLGMTPDMLQERYGHHHPDFQSDAARAVSASPSRHTGGQIGDKMTVNETRRTSSSVTKINGFSGGSR